MERMRNKTPIIFFSALVIIIIAICLTVPLCSKSKPDSPSDKSPSVEETEADGESISLTVDGKHVDENSTAHTGSPEELVGKVQELLVKANDSGDAQVIIDFLGSNTLSPNQSAKLHQLAAQSRLKLDSTIPFSRVPNIADRWALNLADKNRILLDLKKKDSGEWQVNRITLPQPQSGPSDTPIIPAEDNEAIASVNGFIKAILQLDPTAARNFVDTSKISYAKLAGLCIIFEEGQYQLSPNQPLRKMFLAEKSAGWLARLESTGSKQKAMFAITSKRKDAQSPWKVTEINLDKLLADYTSRFSDGDIHYTPLIQNPKGGDSLAIYFSLDSEELTGRTKRQLNIVANLLKNNPKKQLTISGHTDALGSDAHNLKLSEKRARQVMQYLTEQDVTVSQMKVVGYGKSLPRRPNTTADGKDAPEGRRANRRAEILLNF